VDYENQPGTQMAHLFNSAGAPWLSQKWVREVKERTFGGITPYEGYNGDEDQGQMGALGVLMAMGLFSVDGGASIEPVYEITSPIFDRVTIHLDPEYYPGKKFVITTENNSAENMYIQSARLNGEPHYKVWFTHDAFAKGGKLELELGPIPNKSWGSAE
jgi:putative alpha-1,2-mannosidase